MGAFRNFRKKVKYRSLYYIVVSLIAFSNLIPRKGWLMVCGCMGWIAGVILPHYRKLAVRHLTWVFGNEKSPREIRKLAMASFIMLGKNWGDVLRASRIDSLQELNKFVHLVGMENYDAAVAKGKGVIFVACHLGAFEFQITSMALRGLNFMVIGTPLKDKRLNDLMWKHRNRNGTNYVERDKAMFPMLKVLKSNGSVALLIDQDTKVKSTFVDFFGRPASTPVSAAQLAMRTGAAVLAAFGHLGKDGKQHIEILPEMALRMTGNEEDDIRFNTGVFTRLIEEKIRAHPEQWVWMHERWKTSPPALPII